MNILKINQYIAVILILAPGAQPTKLPSSHDAPKGSKALLETAQGRSAYASYIHKQCNCVGKHDQNDLKNCLDGCYNAPINMQVDAVRNCSASIDDSFYPCGVPSPNLKRR